MYRGRGGCNIRFGRGSPKWRCGWSGDRGGKRYIEVEKKKKKRGRKRGFTCIIHSTRQGPVCRRGNTAAIAHSLAFNTPLPPSSCIIIARSNHCWCLMLYPYKNNNGNNMTLAFICRHTCAVYVSIFFLFLYSWSLYFERFGYRYVRHRGSWSVYLYIISICNNAILIGTSICLHIKYITIYLNPQQM